MNYSFIDKFEVKDFLGNNPNGLYNECDPNKKFVFERASALLHVPVPILIEQRFMKFRNLGVVSDTSVE